MVCRLVIWRHGLNVEYVDTDNVEAWRHSRPLPPITLLDMVAPIPTAAGAAGGGTPAGGGGKPPAGAAGAA